MQSDRIDSANYYSFGPYTLNKAGLELLKDGKQVPLTRKRFEVLLLLVENAGQVMLKEEILERIWPDQYIDEANLANNIHAIRRLIEEDPRTPRLIQTIPGRGYKFQGIVDVKAILPAEVSAVKVETEQLPKSRMSTWLIVAVVGLFLAGLTGWFLRRSTVPEKVATPSFPQPLTAYPGTERFPALTPDGKLIAFTWNGDQLENEDIYVRQTIESELVRLTSHPGADQMPTWSPDGHYIAFLRSAEKKGNPRHLMVIPALGGTEREIALVDDGLDWSPDGQYLAISGLNESGGGMGIFLISIDGNVRRRLTSPPPKGGSFDSTPRYSPLHEAQLNFHLLKPLGQTNIPSFSEIQDMSKNFRSTSPSPINGDYIVLHPFSKGSAVEYPLHNYVELAERLIEKGFTVVVTGTAAEAEKIGVSFDHLTGVVNAVAKYSLQELMGIIHHAKGFVACSTGPLHLSGIMNVKTIGLFSPKKPIDPGRWAPLGAQTQCLVFNQECKDCQRKKPCNCIARIPVERIVEALLS